MTTRRAMLRALGLGAVAAPLLPRLPSHADEAPSPRRLIFVHFAHGVALDRFVGGLSLAPILAPLEPFRSRACTVEGIVNHVGRAQVGDIHNIGLGTLLTAAPLAADQGAGGHYLPGGISIDRLVGEALAELPGGPAHASLHFGVRTEGFALSAAGPELPLRAEDDPVAQFEAVFGELVLPPGERTRRESDRAAVRQYARRRLDRLAATLPMEDREAIERHADAIDTLQARAASLLPPPDTCTLPEPPPAIEDPRTPDNTDVPALVQSTNALVTAALACDLTRVATVQWGSSGNDGLRHVWQGIDVDYHSIAHLANGEDPVAHEQLAAMNTWTVEQLADLLSRLDAVDEGDGTLLDHTVVVLLSSFSIVHDMTALPIVIAGGGIAGDRRVVDEGRSTAGLWVALAQHLGLPELDTFGSPEHFDGPIVGLV